MMLAPVTLAALGEPVPCSARRRHLISSLTTASRDERGGITLPLGSELTHPSRLEYITGTATVHTTKGGSQAQLDSLAHEVEQRCPVANMITMSGCSLSIKWEYAADADAECSSD